MYNIFTDTGNSRSPGWFVPRRSRNCSSLLLVWRQFKYNTTKKCRPCESTELPTEQRRQDKFIGDLLIQVTA